MITRPEAELEPPAAADVSASKPHVWMEENLGAAIGVIAGGAAGVVAGPLGIVVGASVGVIIGEAASDALQERAVESSKPERDRVHAVGINAAAKSATLLRADHDRLEALAEHILQTIIEGDREDVASAIQELQTRVLAHLDGEERDLIPHYAQHAPEDAALILQAHAAIRTTLANLDVATDLHLVRADAMRAFLGRLRAHARRENAGLYRSTVPGL